MPLVEKLEPYLWEVRTKVPDGIARGLFTVDGHVMIMHDVLGLTLGRKPTFAKVYAQLAESAKAAFAEYVEDVRGGSYPGPEHCYKMADGEAEKLNDLLPNFPSD